MSYQVKANATEVAIQSGKTETVSFTVNNTSNLTLLTLTQVHTRGSVEKAWCTLKPSEDTSIVANGNHVFELTIAPKGVKKPTSGHVSLQAAWVDDPSNVGATSSEVAVTLLQAAQERTWWQRHGVKVLVGAAVVLVLGSIPFFMPEAEGITSFHHSPKEVKVGGTVTFSWEVAGKPIGLELELTGEESTSIDASAWEKGEIDYIPVSAGPLTARLGALYAGDGPDDPPTLVSKPLSLEVAPAAQAFVTPSITTFKLETTAIKAGDPAVFRWEIAGDISGLQLITDEDSLNINNRDHWSAGTHRSLQFAGKHVASLLVTGMDGKEVKSEPLSFDVKEDAAVQQPDVSFVVTPSGSFRNIKGLFAKVELKWSVGQPHKKVELLHGATREAVNAEGTKTLGHTKTGTKITLLVTLMNGQIMAHDRVVGNVIRAINPKLFDSSAVMNGPNARNVVPK